MDDIIKTSTPQTLSAQILNQEKHQAFFEKLSEVIKHACKTIENAQMHESPINALFLSHHLSEHIKELDEKNKGIPGGDITLINLRANMKITKKKLKNYGKAMAQLALRSPINENPFTKWIAGHKEDFEKLTDDKKLIEYLNEIERLIEVIQDSVTKHRKNIDEHPLKHLNDNISKCVLNLHQAFESKVDPNSKLLDLDQALDEEMENKQLFGDLQVNIKQIQHDLNELKTLIDKSRSDMDNIFKSKKLPTKKPAIHLEISGMKNEEKPTLK